MQSRYQNNRPSRKKTRSRYAVVAGSWLFIISTLSWVSCRTLAQTDPFSTNNVPKTCGRCHALVEQVYDQSVHGQLLNKGDKRGPTCIQCHSSHESKTAVGPELRAGIDHKCGGCHEDRLKRYRETFHGKAIALGRDNVAACSDCHGHHDIVASSNPESRVHDQNRLRTCRSCHPQATRNFADWAKFILSLMQGQAVAAVLHRVGAIITVFYYSAPGCY